MPRMLFVKARTVLVAAAAATLLAAQNPPAPPAAPPAPKPARPTGVMSAAEVHSIYLLPMGNGLDQYLATRLVKKGLLRVVTDPSMADAILTDRLGPSLESKLNELYPKEEPEEVKPDPTAAGGAPPTEAEKAEANREEQRQASERAMDRARAEYMAQRSTYGRGKGNYYLVDRFNRVVLWSAYERPKNSQPDVLDKTAGRIVSELEKVVRPKK